MAIGRAECTCKTCGKIFEKKANKYNSDEARHWVTWAEANITECDDCYRARQTREAAERSSAAGLPELTGSEKQIAWATRIRARKLDEMRIAAEQAADKLAKAEAQATPERVAQMAAAKGMTEEQVLAQFAVNSATYRARYIEPYERAKTESSAAWWIDNQ